MTDYTRNKVAEIMYDKLNARLAATCPGPNESSLQFWQVGSEIVIVQMFKDVGCAHYVQGDGITWQAMEDQLQQIRKKDDAVEILQETLSTLKELSAYIDISTINQSKRTQARWGDLKERARAVIAKVEGDADAENK